MPRTTRTTQNKRERRGRPALRNDRREDVGSLRRKVKRPQTDWRAEQERARRYFAARAERLAIVETTKTPGGHVLDWIKPESQQPHGRLAPPPSETVPITPPERGRAETLAQFELQNPKVARGPAGTVPVWRRDAAKLRVSTTFENFLSKHGATKSPMFLSDDHRGLEVPGDGAHDYAYTA